MSIIKSRCSLYDWLSINNIYLIEANKANSKQQIEVQASGSMLTPGIAQSYTDQVDGYRGHLSLIAEGRADGHNTAAAIFEVKASELTDKLLDECFGPFTLLVVCEDQAELLKTIEKLRGQLSASIHGSEAELASNSTIIDALELWMTAL